MTVKNSWLFPSLEESRNTVSIVLLSIEQYSVSSWGEQEKLTLSEDELERLARIKHDQTRQQYWLARAALRQWLAQILHCMPGDVRFEKNQYGRPFLAYPSCQHIDFNISHCDEWVAIAVSYTDSEQVDNEPNSTVSLGVDIESSSRSTEVLSLAERFFHPKESAFIRSLPKCQQEETFFSIWTAKEAYVKALGTGLQTSLDSFVVDNLLSDCSSSKTPVFNVRGGYFPIRKNGEKLEETRVRYWKMGDSLHLSCVQLGCQPAKVNLWLLNNNTWLIINH